MPLKQEMWNNSVNHRTEFQRWIASASSRWTQQQNTTVLHCSAPEADWSLQHSYCHVLFLHIHSWTNSFPLRSQNLAPLCCQPTGTHDPRGRSPWAAPSQWPPGASPRPVSTLDSSTRLARAPTAPSAQGRSGAGRFGGIGTGDRSLGPLLHPLLSLCLFRARGVTRGTRTRCTMLTNPGCPEKPELRPELLPAQWEAR